MVQPVFIISLPRSGSTLLQRILMAHDGIASHAEPWFLLPLISMQKRNNIKTRYGHIQSANAIQNIIKTTSQEVIDSACRNFALEVYTQLSEKEAYFLDKTPRYYYIINDLYRVFPDAKFIYLLRNPVEIYNSMIQEFKGKSTRRLDHLDGDLINGTKLIAEAIAKYGQNENTFVVQYDEVCIEPVKTVSSIQKFLGLDEDPEIVSRFPLQVLHGHGDSSGMKKYQDNVGIKISNFDHSSTFLAKYYFYALSNKLDIRYLNLVRQTKQQMLSDLKKSRTKFRIVELFYLMEIVFIKMLKRIVHKNDY